MIKQNFEPPRKKIKGVKRFADPIPDETVDEYSKFREPGRQP